MSWAQRAISSFNNQTELLPNLQCKLLVDDDRQIWLLSLDTWPSEAYILKVRGSKSVKPNDTAIESILDEYERLESAWAHIKHTPEKLSMSIPIAVQAEQGLILMSLCRGVNLNSEFNHHILRRFRLPSDFKYKMSNCGRWLKKLHKHSALDNKPTDYLTNRSEHFHRMLSNIPISEDFRCKLSHHFDKILSNDSAPSLCLNHGNFALRNIMGEKDSISLVDFEDSRIEVFSYDLGQFIAELLYKSQYPWLSTFKVNILIQAFLDGYFEDESNHTRQKQQSSIHALTGYHLLCHYYELTSRTTRQGLASKLVFWYRQRFLCKLLYKWAENTPN